jgi:hypothetical protein
MDPDPTFWVPYIPINGHDPHVNLPDFSDGPAPEASDAARRCSIRSNPLAKSSKGKEGGRFAWDSEKINNFMTLFLRFGHGCWEMIHASPDLPCSVDNVRMVRHVTMQWLDAMNPDDEGVKRARALSESYSISS